MVASRFGRVLRRGAAPLPRTRRSLSGAALAQLGAQRFYVQPGERRAYGPLGAELKKNLLQQWWASALGCSRERILPIGSPLKLANGGVPELGGELRADLLQGALQQYVPSLDLVGRRLPFGLAESGVCFPASEEALRGVELRCSPVTSAAEVTLASLAWFSSPRTSSQWLDHWTRQRMKWWRRFASTPSDFTSSDVDSKDLKSGTSHGVRILYRFPWGSEPLETLWSLGDTELLRTHQGARTKLQCRDGRRSVVPYVISMSSNMDHGLLAYLSNSLQQVQKVDGKQRLHQRKVLKLHPALAPVKVALDMGRGATVELRQVCEGLLQELQEAGITAWPGYLETAPQSMEQLHTKYDEMGVLFTMVISESTLESGLLHVRSRDTTIRETKHISEVKKFLLKYISAAENI
ncbi:DNA polymerase subunit gamma-2, mitochondrial isoform X1 [Denticeps clupeoides]|uniref:DNA polymerase subunit gamma-2, mitochondrial isoform X1 n=1 Tax=Denticeps clupeoides TaxID=299321 RepID=UPI0010A58BA6|nr:DNA polymerase subunit gamma-2, mitochondrial isoform X1 [Denticeps clupeoides]